MRCGRVRRLGLENGAVAWSLPSCSLVVGAQGAVEGLPLVSFDTLTSPKRIRSPPCRGTWPECRWSARSSRISRSTPSLMTRKGSDRGQLGLATHMWTRFAAVADTTRARVSTAHRGVNTRAAGNCLSAVELYSHTSALIARRDRHIVDMYLCRRIDPPMFDQTLSQACPRAGSTTGWPRPLRRR